MIVKLPEGYTIDAYNGVWFGLTYIRTGVNVLHCQSIAEKHHSDALAMSTKKERK